MTSPRFALTLSTGLAAALALSVPAVVQAQASDPAAAAVDGLNDALIATMKAGRAAGASGRLRKIEPAVERAFDLTVMTRTAVGQPWLAFSPAEQAQVVKAFSRFIAASYAKNFDAYDGETFTIDPKVEARGPDKFVKCQLVPKSGAPTNFVYRMRQSAGGGWRIVDVFYNGTISQVAAQHSQFASASGADAIAKQLDAKTADLLK
jgi:phospholipid transport system substrate-binding protein